MDFLPILIFIIMGSLILNNQRKKRRPPTDEEYDETSGGQSGNRPTTWEEMERQYGIRIERKDSPSSVETAGMEESGVSNDREAATAMESRDARREYPQETKLPQRPLKRMSNRETEVAWQQEVQPNAQGKVNEAYQAYIKKAEQRRMSQALDTETEFTIGQRSGRKPLPKSLVTGAKAGIIWATILEAPRSRRK